MSERLRRISIIGVCISALLAVAIIPLQADAKSTPAPKTTAAKKAAAAKKRAAAKQKAAKAAAARRAAARRRRAALAASTSTTTAPATTTTMATAPTVPTVPTAPTTTTTMQAPAAPTPPVSVCVGVPLVNGQSDINAQPAGTTFCVSGTHNWTLSPKSGDQLIGPAVLDGQHSTQWAIEAGSATNVVLANLEIRNYTVANQQGAIHTPYDPTGWTLRDLQVHDNGTSAGGAGASLGQNWQVIGGRYYNNRQEGFGWTGSGNTLDGVEIDHNNFTDDTYTKRNIDCGFEAGGFKWTADNITVKNSSIHDNACRGLWADMNADNAVITNNQVYNNWDEGIFIEISTNTTVTGNTVYNNGWHCYEGTGNGCIWLLGGGITLLASDHADIGHNNVYGNFNGITGVQENRPDGNPGLLQNDNIHDNTIAGPGGKTGLVANNGANLATRNITFTNNTYSNGMNFCSTSC